MKGMLCVFDNNVCDRSGNREVRMRGAQRRPFEAVVLEWVIGCGIVIRLKPVTYYVGNAIVVNKMICVCVLPNCVHSNVSELITD